MEDELGGGIFGRGGDELRKANVGQRAPVIPPGCIDLPLSNQGQQAPLQITQRSNQGLKAPLNPPAAPSSPAQPQGQQTGGGEKK